ncbi:MAG: phosphohistidine phosphatase SixA [Nitrososphaeraceae archaeon]
MELFLIRHGEAGKRLQSGSKDFDRPLTSTGQKEVESISISLKKLKINFDRIITSPLKRAHQTAVIVSNVFVMEDNRVEDWGELKPEGNRLELYKKLSQLKSDSSLLIIGHQPYLSEMIGNLIFDYDSDNDPRIILKKSGLAKIVITSLMPTMKGELRWLLNPKLLRKI